MPIGPDPAHADDPRLPELLRVALAKHAIPPELADPVRKLVTGQASPLEFRCCDSGCIPCNKDYMRAAEKVLVALAEGPAKGRRGGSARPWWAFWRKR